MESYLGVARKMGISDEEVGAIQSIVMAVSAGKVNAQLNEVLSRTEAPISVGTGPAPIK
jgi:hypothetical protein